MDVKGNKNGKAVPMKLSTQLLLVFVLAVAVVASVKTFGTASWHAKSVREEHQDVHDAESISDAESAKAASVPDAAVAKVVVAENLQDDNNLIKIVWGNLDGEIGSEGVCCTYRMLCIVRIRLLTNTLTLITLCILIKSLIFCINQGRLFSNFIQSGHHLE